MNALGWSFTTWTRFGLPAALFVGADERAWRDDRLGVCSGSSDASAYWARVASYTAPNTNAHRAALAAAALTGIAQ